MNPNDSPKRPLPIPTVSSTQTYTYTGFNLSDPSPSTQQSGQQQQGEPPLVSIPLNTSTSNSIPAPQLLSPNSQLPYNTSNTNSPNDGSDMNHFSDRYLRSEVDHEQLQQQEDYLPTSTFPPLPYQHEPVRMSSESVSTHSSTLPLQYKVTLAPDTFQNGSNHSHKQYPTSNSGNDRIGRSKDRSGYKSPSRPNSADRLGNWSGAGGRASPYGPLGDGGGGNGGNGNGGGQGGDTDSRRGVTSPSSSALNLLYADGDFLDPESSNAFTRFIFKIYDSTFIIRWIVYIIPLLVLIWIPGIIGVTAAKEANVWGVKLFYWSVWLTVVWCGWWACALVSRLAAPVLKNSVGIVAPQLKHYITYIQSTQFYIGFFGWALINWVSFLPLINANQIPGSISTATISLVTQFLFGIFIVVTILLGEKLMIQVIAHNFHKKSYEARIMEQKANINILTALYLHSHDLGRSDTLDGGMYPTRPGHKRQLSDPTLLVKKAVKGVRKTAQTISSIIGVVAAEIAGEKIIQPNSPGQMVSNALTSTKKTKHLARRIYYSFTPAYRNSMVLDDIRKVFNSLEAAEKAFALFDRDTNGDATLEEVEMSCLDIKAERAALTSSMTDIDSAVGRLDSIIMSLYYVVSIIIIIGLLDASFNTMIASAGTLILGLSWLIGTTAQEILASIIFLFVKHLYDVGDRVDIDGVSYIVLEMHLLSTIFKRTDGMIVQAPHVILNQKFVNNIRRSGAISETFTWDVDFATSFEKIEALRERMLEFLEIERRDFTAAIDITVKDFAKQGCLTLSADIRYRSNWQNGSLKALRRNKWLCALKICMATLEIYGPSGAGDPSPPPADPTHIVMVPFDEAKEKKGEEEKEKAKMEGEPSMEMMMQSGKGIQLRSREEVMKEVEGEEPSKGLGERRF